MKTKNELEKMSMKALLAEGNKVQDEVNALRSKGYEYHSPEVASLMAYNSIILAVMAGHRQQSHDTSGRGGRD